MCALKSRVFAYFNVGYQPNKKVHDKKKLTNKWLGYLYMNFVNYDNGMFDSQRMIEEWKVWKFGIRTYEEV